MKNGCYIFETKKIEKRKICNSNRLILNLSDKIN